MILENISLTWLAGERRAIKGLRTMSTTTTRAINGSDPSIVAVDRFIQATRDSGYKGTVSAIAELVDNAIEAEATRIDIVIGKLDADDPHPIQVAIADNGSGMTASVLRQALRFGGSTRFGSRQGLGRYGMGLPNASLSQSRRVEVYTRRHNGRFNWSFLDVDDIASGQTTLVPKPKPRTLPRSLQAAGDDSNTLVVWNRCDRLDHRRVSTLERKLHLGLGRVFRHFIWQGVTIRVNDEDIVAVDPLYLQADSVITGGLQVEEIGERICLPICVDGPDGSPLQGEVEVRFSMLPVNEWHMLSNKEKRARGITNGAGISIVRAGREIEYGWYFMGGKRRENYDDWWRGEVRFGPELDEAFGVTHTKQGIKPIPALVEALGKDLGEIGRMLAIRVRESHEQVRERRDSSEVTRRATVADSSLTPLSADLVTDVDRELAKQLDRCRQAPKSGDRYEIIETPIPDSSFFRPVFDGSHFRLVINPEHRFAKRVYRLLRGDGPNASPELRDGIKALLLAAARAEFSCSSPDEREVVEQFRERWSNALHVYLQS